jgi:hypothetical protein
MRLTIFSWGYFGWGNATRELVAIVDAVEARRGFAPPVFVDIRIRRNVRAAGFSGRHFAELLGPERHVWLPGLGNRFIVSRQGPKIQIDEPGAVQELLSLALRFSKQHRRVLFFCGCAWPRENGVTCCHRDTVAELLLIAARAAGQSIEVVEWPGGEPGQFLWTGDGRLAKALAVERARLPVGESFDLAEAGTLPWGTILEIDADRQPRGLIGPVQYSAGGWTFPLLQSIKGDENTKAAFEQASDLRRRLGLNARLS